MAKPKRPKKWKSPIAVERSKEWLRRSAAARKGWQTRKKRELPKKIARERKLEDNARILLGKKPNSRVGQKRKKTVKQLERLLDTSKRKNLEYARALQEQRDKAHRELNKIHLAYERDIQQITKLAMSDVRTEAERDAYAKYEAEILGLKWSPDYGSNRVREDGTVALEVCQLRNKTYTEELKQQLDRASGGNFGVQLEELTKRQKRYLSIEAHEIATKYDVSLKEVYTLFFSP